MATQESRSMVSETSICNQALSWLGGPQITSLDEDSRFAAWMKANYPFIRDAVMEERMWSFATAKATSTVTDMDAWETSMYKHPIPADWISVFRCYRNVVGQDPRDWLPAIGWRLEQRNVVSADSTIYMWGIQRITDTGLFSPMFTQALAARIASDAAIPLTENRQLQADMWQLYQGKLDQATVRDGMQGLSDKISRGRFITTRGRRGELY